MDKYDMKEWVSRVEAMADSKLKKWRKDAKMENGEAVQLKWQYEQSHILLDIFWEDGKETVHFQYHSPRASQRFEWHGLTNATFNNVQDKIGNLAMVTMYPLIDPESDT